MLVINEMRSRMNLRISLFIPCFFALVGTAFTSAAVTNDTLSPQSAELVACPDMDGGLIATFDLTSAESLILPDGTPELVFTWFADVDTSIIIPIPGAYESTDGTVYALITSSIDTSCRLVAPLVLSVNTPPDLSYLGDLDTVCGRTSIALGIQDGPEGVYLWSPGNLFEDSTVANPNFIPVDGEGMYTIQVTAWTTDSACSVSETFTFLHLDALFEITGDDHIFNCKEDTITNLTAETSGDPADIIWMTDQGTLSENVGLTTTLMTAYSSTVTAMQTFDNGCKLTRTVFVQVDSIPMFDIEFIPDVNEPCMKYCPGQKVSLTTQSASPDCYPDLEYEWMPRAGQGGDYDADTTGNVVLALSNANTQLYIRTATNNACVERDSHLIEVVDTIPMILGLPDRVCRGFSFDLEIDPAYIMDGDFTDIMWSVDGDIELECGSCEDETSVRVNVSPDAARGFATVQVMGLKEFCCTATGSLTIPIDVPIIDIMPDEICDPDLTDLVADTGFINYMWSADAGSVNQDGSNMATLINVPNNSSFVNVGVTAIDNEGCEGEGNAALPVINEFLLVTPLDTAICPGGEVNYFGDPAFTNYAWQITGGSGGSLNGGTTNSPTLTTRFEDSGGMTFTIQVDAVSPNGCPVRRNLFVRVFDDQLVLTPTCREVQDNDSLSVGDRVVFNARIIPPGTESNIMWTGQGDVMNDTSFSVVLQVGPTSFSYSWESPNGCIIQDSCTISRDVNVFFPNVFSPTDRNNPKNQVFGPLDPGSRQPLSEQFIQDFKIYNRWGQLVYDNDDNAVGWDGRQDGEIAPSDVYIYKAEINTDGAGTVTYTGDVTLLR